MKKLFEYYINILQNTQTADLVATVIAERSWKDINAQFSSVHIKPGRNSKTTKQHAIRN